MSSDFLLAPLSVEEKEHISLRSCNKCIRKTPDIRVCAQCKSTNYCSKKCQKDHWPEHKFACSKSAQLGIAGRTKLIRQFWQDFSFRGYLSLALYHKFQALGYDLSPDKPLMAQLFVGVEPADIHALGPLKANKNFIDEGQHPLGIFQLLSINVPFESPSNALAQNMNRYERSRSMLDEEGLSTVPIACVEVITCSVENGDFAFGIDVLVLPMIHQFEEKLDVLSIRESPMGEKCIEKPATAESYMEFVNMLIRSDVANKYHLRKKMHWTEMGVLIAALNGRHCDKKLGEKFLDAWRGKVAREDIYSSIRARRIGL